MKKNKDNLAEVTNEIGNLLELFVQCAREHKPTSERFVGACNDFLRLVYLFIITAHVRL
jgi:hypothetical protein